MKHVWLVNHYAQEPGNAGGTRHHALAAHLPASGWRASIVAASVELNTGRQRLAPGERQRLQRIGEVPMLWLRVPTYAGNGLGRMRNMLAFAWRACLPGSTRALDPPDAVVGSSVHPFAALAGWWLARRWRVPFLFEVRDLWPQTLIDLGRLRERSPVAWAMRRLERFLYRRAATTITLLPHAAEYIAANGGRCEAVAWIPNGVDVAAFPALPPRPDGDEFVLMYFGAHGEANGLDNVLRAYARARAQADGARLRLRLIGDGPLKPALRALAAELGLPDGLFEDPVPKERIPALAAQADAFVFNLVDAPVFRFGISSNKLFDFMAAARPILFCCNASNNPVADAQAGVTVPPGDPDALAAAMQALARTPAEARARQGAAGRRYVEQDHGYAHLAGRLAAVLDRAVGAR